MKARRLTLVVLLYGGADLSTPFMPGAFCVSPEESVEATGGPQHVRKLAAVSPGRFKVDTPEPRRPSFLSRPERGAGVPTNGLDEWFVDLRRAHTPFHEPPSAADDH